MFCPTMDLLKCHYLPKIIQQPQIFVQNAKYVLSSCTYCCCLTQEFINPFFCDLNESTILRLSLRFMKIEEMSIRKREIQQCRIISQRHTNTFDWVFLIKAKLTDVNSEKDKKFRSFELEIHYSWQWRLSVLGWPNLRRLYYRYCVLILTVFRYLASMHVSRGQLDLPNNN